MKCGMQGASNLLTEWATRCKGGQSANKSAQGVNKVEQGANKAGQGANKVEQGANKAGQGAAPA